jgi:hypothetical protein
MQRGSLDQLVVFVAVARLRSLTRAAVSQPALSHTVRTYEPGSKASDQTQACANAGLCRGRGAAAGNSGLGPARAYRFAGWFCSRARLLAS